MQPSIPQPRRPPLAVPPSTVGLALPFTPPLADPYPLPLPQVTPLGGFSYMDPTSFWRVSGRTFVLCTLRCAPDYLSFEQIHHQSMIYEVHSSLLDGLEEDLGEKEGEEDLVWPDPLPAGWVGPGPRRA